MLEQEVIALYDYAGQEEGHLHFREGDVLFVTKRIDDDWLEGHNASEDVHGLIPAAYVEVHVLLQYGLSYIY